MSQRPRARTSRASPLSGGIATLAAALLGDPAARAQSAAPASPSTTTSATATPSSPEENLTVRGQRQHFESAPMPGAPLGPPPEGPGQHPAHLGRYTISGDQTKKDGYDAQTGAYIAPFGSAYTQAGPTADGLASRFGH